MASTKFFWKVWLRPNLLTKDVDNDYIAVVSTVNNTRRNEDIARSIIDSGSEIQYDTLLNILNRSDGVIREMLQSGESVQTGVCRLSPRVSGSWIGSSATFDPSVLKITLDITPTAEMREALTSVGVEVLDVKGSGAYIGLVTDTATNRTDGTITAGDDVMIEGDKIRISPDGDTTVDTMIKSK
ncbi:MAG: DNA-binding domain-containing protein [Paludibacteraceae bacterium]